MKKIIYLGMNNKSHEVFETAHVENSKVVYQHENNNGKKDKFIEDALQYIADQDEDADLDRPEIEADTYTSELTKWLHSRNDRVYYLTEALEEYEINDGFQALYLAQLCERGEVYDSVLNSLRELCKDQEDEEE